MKRSALGQSLQGGVSVTVDSEDCDSSFEDTAEPKAKKRKYSENTVVTDLLPLHWLKAT